MTTTTLVLLGAASVLAILALIIKLKAHPFLALLLVSIALALIAGIPLNEVIPMLSDGMGQTLGSVALIVTLGAMLGKIIELSGGADVLARKMLDIFGVKRAPWALGLASFLFGIPVFVDVALIVLVPIVLSVARKLGGNVLTIALPTVVALLTVHVILPPHPGIVGGAEIMGAPVGMVLVIGLIPAILMWLFAQSVLPLLTARVFSPVPAAVVPAGGTQTAESAEAAGSDTPDQQDDASTAKDSDPAAASAEQSTPQPSIWLILSLITTPLALIMLQTVSSMVLDADSPVVAFFDFLGASPMALLIGVILAAITLGRSCRWSLAHANNVINSALPAIAAIILITGAGGTFGYVLTETGVASAVAEVMASTGLPIIVLAYLMAALIRAAQGSATVSVLTTAPLIAPLAIDLGLSPAQIALVTVAIGIGSMALSHVNDSLFWVWSGYFKVSTATALKSYSLITTATSVVGFGVVCGLWPAVALL